MGGPLSHGSIVAREHLIPAVLRTGVSSARITSVCASSHLFLALDAALTIGTYAESSPSFLEHSRDKFPGSLGRCL